jgi:hypothetical protein
MGRCRVIRLAVLLDEICNERIWASGVTPRAGHSQNAFIRANRETFNFTEFRVFQLFVQQFQVMFAAGLVAMANAP